MEKEVEMEMNIIRNIARFFFMHYNYSVFEKDSLEVANLGITFGIGGMWRYSVKLSFINAYQKYSPLSPTGHCFAFACR